MFSFPLGPQSGLRIFVPQNLVLEEGWQLSEGEEVSGVFSYFI